MSLFAKGMTYKVSAYIYMDIGHLYSLGSKSGSQLSRKMKLKIPNLTVTRDAFQKHVLMLHQHQNIFLDLTQLDFASVEVAHCHVFTSTQSGREFGSKWPLNESIDLQLHCGKGCNAKKCFGKNMFWCCSSTKTCFCGLFIILT